MEKSQIDKLRSMNLGVIADQVEEIISRNARLTADNRRHMQRVEALERECGHMALHIKNGGSSLPAGWRLVPEKSNPEWIELLCELGYSTSPKSVIDHILAAAPKAPVTVPKQEPALIGHWNATHTHFQTIELVDGLVRGSYADRTPVYIGSAPAQAATVPPEWREAVQEFVDRVERGEIRSSYTVGKFKALLGGSDRLALKVGTGITYIGLDSKFFKHGKLYPVSRRDENGSVAVTSETGRHHWVTLCGGDTEWYFLLSPDPKSDDQVEK